MNESLKNLGKSITSAYGVIESIIRKHFWCILVILLVAFLLSMAKGSDADRLSLASSVLSIVLAVIVVILSIVHTCDMKNLVDEASKSMEKTVDKGLHFLERQFKSQLNAIVGNGRSLPDTTDIEEGDVAKLNLKNCLFAALAFLYVVAKSEQSKKPFKCTKVASIVFYYDPRIVEGGISTYFFGIMNALEISWQPGLFELEEDGHHVKNLPSSFMQEVEGEITRRITEGPIDPKIKKRFQYIKKEIDEYFKELE